MQQPALSKIAKNYEVNKKRLVLKYKNVKRSNNDIFILHNN